MSTTTATEAPKTETRKPYEIPTYPALKATGKRGIYGDEWDSDLRAIVCAVAMGCEDPETGDKHCQARFEAVLHPEHFRDFCVNSRNGAGFSIMRVELVWHSFGQNSGDGAVVKGDEGKGALARRERREVDQYGKVKGNLGCKVGVWDIDNNRWVYKVCAGDKYGKVVWVDRRYLEIKANGRPVNLPSGNTGFTTQPEIQ